MDGMYYYGNFEQGSIKGDGIMIFNEGTYMHGDFDQNMVKSGILYNKNQNINQEIENGKWITYQQNSTSYLQEWQVLDLNSKKSYKYQGQMVRGVINGRGRQYFLNKNNEFKLIFEGDWNFGQKNLNQGISYYINGDINQ